jgi:hypothetical protein
MSEQPVVTQTIVGLVRRAVPGIRSIHKNGYWHRGNGYDIHRSGAVVYLYMDFTILARHERETEAVKALLTAEGYTYASERYAGDRTRLIVAGKSSRIT